MGKLLSHRDWREETVTEVEEMCDELYEWRELHPEASLDDIAARLRPRRRQVMGRLLSGLACQQGNGTSVEGIMCPSCGQRMVYKGDRPCTKEHAEGEITLKRAYYHCRACKAAFFPPGRPTAADRA